MTATPPKDYFAARAQTEEGDTPRIEAEFRYWRGGFGYGRDVAVCRLRITGKTKKRTADVTLRRVSRVVGDDDLQFAVFTVGRLIPPVWRAAATNITHSVCAAQWQHEREAEQQAEQKTERGWQV